MKKKLKNGVLGLGTTINMNSELARFGDIIKKINTGFRSIDFEGIRESFRLLDERLPSEVKLLGEHGWFMSSWHTPLTGIVEVASVFRSGDIAEGDRVLSMHFSNIKDDIKKALYRDFPERSVILKKAFIAHDNHDYELSIPVFLAQADGIAKSALGVSIYSRRPDLVKKLRDAIDDLGPIRSECALVRVALEDLPITASSHSPAYKANELNRHEVLHGIDTNYASAVNSWKAVSWLQYAAHFQEAVKYAAKEKQV